ncbi:hypothetical protein TNCV_128331 [Trichonephila clavipes]|nr:hypothetical protein TNCV_128331 [Trichonephila clavipes]
MQLFDSTENPSPNIKKLCEALKTTPPTSVEAERAFSAAGLFVTKYPVPYSYSFFYPKNYIDETFTEKNGLGNNQVHYFYIP